MSSIITTCPKVWEGTGAYWYLKHLEFISEVVLRDVQHIPWEEFQVKDAELIITCGIGEVDLLKLRKQKAKIGVLFCSPLAQAHVVPTSPNGDLDSLLRYKNMLESGDIDYIFLASQKLADLFVDKRIIYLPPPLRWDNNTPMMEINARNGIGYFGTMDRHKNLATMFGAVKHSGIEDPFILTGPEKVSMCSFFSNLFNMKNIKVYPRLPRQELLKVMSEVKLGVQISFSEAFNYATWELAMLEIPSIVGPSIWWYVKDNYLKKYCTVENLDDSIEIGEMIRRIYFNLDLYSDLCKISKEEATVTMEKNNQMIREILEKV